MGLSQACTRAFHERSYVCLQGKYATMLYQALTNMQCTEPCKV